MAKHETIYTCSHCDAQSLKWSGRCLDCGKWGTLVAQDAEVEEVKAESTKANVSKLEKFAASQVQTLDELAQKDEPRITSGISEFDSVLGGGIVLGSLILLGGDPGIGKSTLSLQILHAATSHARKPLYVSGEESGQQIKLRADRLGVNTKSIKFLGQTNVETIIGTISKEQPSLAIVDSIQTIYSKDVISEPGSITQVRACTVKLLEAAKTTNIPIILIGHVTKEGQVAGPKTLEHLVDTVLYLEGDRYQTFRLLRTVKNRFGATNEVGVFDMTTDGLQVVENPSALFVSSTTPLAGSVVTSIMEGSRPFLIEIQALVSKTSFASPQRRASGYDVNRLQLLLAVLNERTKYDFSKMDVHINIVGGLKIKDPSTDLAVCSVLISALSNKPINHQTIILGEVGLAGEVRPIRQLDDRLKEAEKLGYKTAMIPDQKTKNAKLALEKVNNVSLL